MGQLGVPYGDMVSKKAQLRHTHSDSLAQEGSQVAPAEFGVTVGCRHLSKLGVVSACRAALREEAMECVIRSLTEQFEQFEQFVGIALVKEVGMEGDRVWEPGARVPGSALCGEEETAAGRWGCRCFAGSGDLGGESTELGLTGV